MAPISTPFRLRYHVLHEKHGDEDPARRRSRAAPEPQPRPAAGRGRGTLRGDGAQPPGRGLGTASGSQLAAGATDRPRPHRASSSRSQRVGAAAGAAPRRDHPGAAGGHQRQRAGGPQAGREAAAARPSDARALRKIGWLSRFASSVPPTTGALSRAAIQTWTASSSDSPDKISSSITWARPTSPRTTAASLGSRRSLPSSAEMLEDFAIAFT